MLNKKLVLGSLAGATLLVGAAFMLPSAAQAGLVNGTCVNCHTMHNSVEGATVNGQVDGRANLLTYNGCVGCHAGQGPNDTVTGKAGTMNAPQVDDAVPTSMLAGGYFGAVDGNAHSVGVANAGLTAALATAPGGTFTSTSVTFGCVDCHGEANGGHHSYTAADVAKTGVAGNSYRMLRADPDNDGIPTGVFVASGTAPSAGWEVSGAAVNTYNAIGMNAFCADCHGGFHGTANTNAVNPFKRHPTESAGTPIPSNVYTPAYAGALRAVPTGEVGTGVMCISCHRPHGSDNLDLLRFSYGANVAGDTTATLGCETCHGVK